MESICYRVLQIYDPDYGCEGVPDGEKPRCPVVLEDENGIRRTVLQDDEYLTRMAIDEGAAVRIDDRGKLILT